MSQQLLVLDSAPSEQVLEYVLTTPARHVCQTLNPTFHTDLKLAEIMMRDAGRFFEHPITTILDGQNGIQLTTEFSAMSEKLALLETSQSFLSQHIRSKSITSDVSIVIDELFTNAVLNAPFENGSKRIEDNSDIKMTDGKKGQLSLAVKDEQLVIMCRDPYGSLSITMLLERIRDCYVRGVQQMMNMGTGGAGIGSYMVFSTVASYFVAVDKGRITLVGCCIPLHISNRKRLELPKNIHILGY